MSNGAVLNDRATAGPQLGNGCCSSTGEQLNNIGKTIDAIDHDDDDDHDRPPAVRSTDQLNGQPDPAMAKTIPSLFSNIPSGYKYLQVHTLTKEVICIAVHTKCKVKDALSRCLKHIGCNENRLLGLALRTPSEGIGGDRPRNEYLFLDPNRKITKYAPKQRKISYAWNTVVESRPFLAVHLRVRIYVDNIRIIRCPIILRHYYLQLRENLLDQWSSSNSVTEERCWELAALALHADENGNDLLTFHAEQYFPLWIVNIRGLDFMRRNMPAIRKDLSACSSNDAVIGYCQKASKPPFALNCHLYGLRRHKMDTFDNAIINISPKGIEASDVSATGERICLRSLIWSRISKLSFDKRKVTICGSDGVSLSLYAQYETKARYLLEFCKAFHQESIQLNNQLLNKLESNYNNNSNSSTTSLSCVNERYPDDLLYNTQLLFSRTSSENTSGVISDKLGSDANKDLEWSDEGDLVFDFVCGEQRKASDTEVGNPNCIGQRIKDCTQSHSPMNGNNQQSLSANTASSNRGSPQCSTGSASSRKDSSWISNQLDADIGQKNNTPTRSVDGSSDGKSTSSQPSFESIGCQVRTDDFITNHNSRNHESDCLEASVSGGVNNKYLTDYKHQLIGSAKATRSVVQSNEFDEQEAMKNFSKAPNKIRPGKFCVEPVTTVSDHRPTKCPIPSNHQSITGSIDRQQCMKSTVIAPSSSAVTATDNPSECTLKTSTHLAHSEPRLHHQVCSCSGSLLSCLPVTLQQPSYLESRSQLTYDQPMTSTAPTRKNPIAKQTQAMQSSSSGHGFIQKQLRHMHKITQNNLATTRGINRVHSMPTYYSSNHIHDIPPYNSVSHLTSQTFSPEYCEALTNSPCASTHLVTHHSQPPPYDHALLQTTKSYFEKDDVAGSAQLSLLSKEYLSKRHSYNHDNDHLSLNRRIDKYPIMTALLQEHHLEPCDQLEVSINSSVIGAESTQVTNAENDFRSWNGSSQRRSSCEELLPTSLYQTKCYTPFIYSSPPSTSSPSSRAPPSDCLQNRSPIYYRGLYNGQESGMSSRCFQILQACNESSKKNSPRFSHSVMDLPPPPPYPPPRCPPSPNQARDTEHLQDELGDTTFN